MKASIHRLYNFGVVSCVCLDQILAVVAAAADHTSSSDAVDATVAAGGASVKPCNIRLVFPSGAKFKESFADGTKTSVAEVLTRVLDRLPADCVGCRFDLLYGFPPKPLSKRLVELMNERGGEDGRGGVGSAVTSAVIADVSMNNETVTVRYYE